MHVLKGLVWTVCSSGLFAIDSIEYAEGVHSAVEIRAEMPSCGGFTTGLKKFQSIREAEAMTSSLDTRAVF